MTKPTLKQIREFLQERFDNEEINRFCDDYFPTILDEFGDNTSKRKKAANIVGYCERRGKITELLVALYRERPHSYVLELGDKINDNISFSSLDIQQVARRKGCSFNFKLIARNLSIVVTLGVLAIVLLTSSPQTASWLPVNFLTPTPAFFEGPWEEEPNNAPIDGDFNGLLVSGRTYFGTFESSADVTDYFSINLSQTQLVSISLTNIPEQSDYDLTLRIDNSNLDSPAGGHSGAAGSESESIETTVPAGRYFIQVSNRKDRYSTQPYHLVVTYR